MVDQQNDKPGVNLPIKNITRDALHDLVYFDTKLFKTLPILLFKPGLLTQKTLKGDGDAYVKPFALFVFLNFVFFVVKVGGLFRYSLDSYRDIFEDRINAAITRTHLSLPLLTERFNTAMHFEQKEYLIAMVPLFALLVQVLFLTQRRHYIQYLIFALHFYSFFIVILMMFPYLMFVINGLLSFLKIPVQFSNTDTAIATTLMAVCFIYLLFAVRRVFMNNWLLSVIKSAVLSVGVIFLVVYVFQRLMFFIVMHSVVEN